MGTLFAAAPFEDWVREHSPILAAVVCVILGFLVFRLIARTMTRMILLGILLLLTVFIGAERDEITECTQTCSCQLAGIDTDIPFCDSSLPRSGV